jgi:hypothetical protein
MGVMKRDHQINEWLAILSNEPTGCFVNPTHRHFCKNLTIKHMETLSVNYWAIGSGAILSMIIGGIWYGPLFGKKWIQLVGVNPDDVAARKKMQKSAGPLYAVQFLLTLFQILVLAHLVADTQIAGGLERSIWIWAAFVIPTLAGAVMWTNERGQLKWTRFLIQGGYQLVMFIIFGLLLQFWK